MAILIPRKEPNSIALEPERKVAEALCSQLPEDAKIFHSYPWLRPDRDLDSFGGREVIREGEADFVVIHPRFGIVVLEVKGGDMFFNSEEGRWDRHGSRHSVKDPFKQASQSLHKIEEQLLEGPFSETGKLPFSRAYAVIFPNCDYEGSFPPGAHKRNLFGASDLSSIGARIERLFKVQPFVPKSRLSQVTLNGVTRGLTSTFKLVPSLWSEIEDQERKIFRFTEQQLKILEVLDSYTRASIEGVAGSGKTILAKAKARAFVEEGKRVLFLCFNEMLAEWHQNHLPPEYSESLIVSHYHKLCSTWVKDAGLTWPKYLNDENFFQTEAPKLLEKAIDLMPESCFDAIVVDEGQDFENSWWDSIELLNKMPMEGPLYIFYDPDQQIFHDSLAAMPDLGSPFKLPQNCRNTKMITDQCGDIIDKVITVNDGMPIGKKPTFVFAPDGESQVAGAVKQLESWIQKSGGLKYSQVAVVTRGNVNNSSLRGIQKLGRVPTTSSLVKWERGEAVLVTSLYKFKGLETDALILVDVKKPNPMDPPSGFRPSHFYVGCSRAKHLLTIISRDRRWY